MRRLAVVVLLLVGLMAAGWAFFKQPAEPSLAFRTLDGRRMTLDGLRGKVVLVTFWATSCPACIKEMPDLVRTYQNYRGRGLEMVAVAMSYDPPAYVRRYAEMNRLPFPVALDEGGTLAHSLDVRLTPTAFLIDRRGRIVSRTVGLLDFGRLRVFLENNS